MEDLFLVTSRNGALYVVFSRDPERDDFCPVSERPNSVRFIFDDTGWQFDKSNKGTLGTLKLKLRVSDEFLETVLKLKTERKINIDMVDDTNINDVVAIHYYQALGVDKPEAESKGEAMEEDCYKKSVEYLRKAIESINQKNQMQAL